MVFSLIWEEFMPMSYLPIQIFIVYFDSNLQELLLPTIVNHVENCVILELVSHVENCVILGFVSHVENCVILGFVSHVENYVILGFVSHVENCIILGFVVWGLKKKDAHNQFKILLCGYYDNVISLKLRLALMDIHAF